MHHQKGNLLHRGLGGLQLPMQPKALGFGPMSQPPDAKIGLGVEVALEGELVLVEELQELLAVAVTLPGHLLVIQ